MSTRTAPSMAPRDGGGPASPWQRPPIIGASSAHNDRNGRHETLPNSRGYSLPSGKTNKNRRPSSSSSMSTSQNPPSFAPPSSRQERESSSSYHRNEINSNNNHNHNRGDRDRERDQQYNWRNPNEYRPNGFERGHHPARYNNDRDRDNGRGTGYENRPPTYDSRSMGESWNQNGGRNELSSNYREPRELSSYNKSTANSTNRGLVMECERGSNYDYNGEDRRRPIGRSDGNPGNGYRDSMDHPRDSDRRGSFGRDYERERELRHNSETLDYQRGPRHRHNIEVVDFRDRRHDQNGSDCYPSRYSTGREDRNNGRGFQNDSIRRNEYNDRVKGQQHQLPRQFEQRWQAPPSTTPRGDDCYNMSNSKSNEHPDRARFSNHRSGMGDNRTGDSSSSSNAQYSEGTEHRSNEWTRNHRVEARGSLTDGNNRSERSVVAPPRRCEHSGSDLGWGQREHDKSSSGEALARGGTSPHHVDYSHHHHREEPQKDVRAGSTAPPKEQNRSMPSPQRKPTVSSSRSSASLSGNNNGYNHRKRQREDNGEELNTAVVDSKAYQRENTLIETNATEQIPKSLASKSDTIETNSKQGYGESKKIKLTAITTSSTSTLSSSPSLHSSKTANTNSSSNRGIEAKQEHSKNAVKSVMTTKVAASSTLSCASEVNSKKQNPKSITVKSASSSMSTKKKPQIQAKPKPKPTNKLGIPMRWLKPKAKPKPPVKKAPPKVTVDTSKAIKIPSKQKPPASTTKNAGFRPSSPSNRLVTDSSEVSSIVSFKNNNNNAKATSSLKSTSVHAKKQNGTSVPAAIVTKKKLKNASKPKTKDGDANDNSSITDYPEEEPEGEWDSEAESEASDGEASESDTDDDQVLDWASKMLGVPASPSSINPTDSNDSLELSNGQHHNGDGVIKAKSPKLKIRLSAALKLKLTESMQSNNSSGDNGLSEEDGNKLEAALKKLERRKKKKMKLKALSEKINEERPEFDHEKAKLEIEEERRKREEAKTLTAKEIRKISDTFSGGGNQNNWVRRSRRQPNKDLLNSKPVRILVDMLKYNDTSMRVLKMKKYINDPNTPCAVMDAMLNAMEENTNCEALYIQNFNEGMRDEQVLHLLRILQQPSCKIWCLNIGENYNVSDETWEMFTKGLIHTKITHMYASEHTITSVMKDEIRFTIRDNRKKHDMHINPNNIDVIIQCTHCWWNPINAKVLRPYLKKKGYEHVLKDKEAQGLQGSHSEAPTA